MKTRLNGFKTTPTDARYEGWGCIAVIVCILLFVGLFWFSLYLLYLKVTNG